jgi:hypothetical protein
MAATVSSVTVTGLPAQLSSSVASLPSLNRFKHIEMVPLTEQPLFKLFANLYEYRKKSFRICVNLYNKALFVDAV